MLLKIQDSDKMSEAKQGLKKQRYNLSRKPLLHPTGIVRLSLVSMDRSDRPDLSSHLKYCSDDRDDYVETLPGTITNDPDDWDDLDRLDRV